MATHLTTRTLVRCPVAQSARRITGFFREHGNADGDVAKLSLFLDVNVPGLSASLSVRRAVIVTLQNYRSKADTEPRYRIQWAPAEPGPFPLFTGELRVENDESYDAFDLVLDGVYEPPLGIVGVGFDTIVGAGIAETCARNLLRTLARDIEGAFAVDEAKKPALGAFR